MNIMDIKPLPTPSFDVPKRPVVRPSGVVVPRGDIVLSKRQRPIVPRPRVTIAGPGLRPDATAVRIEAARSALQTLADARDGFVACAPPPRRRLHDAARFRPRRQPRRADRSPAAEALTPGDHPRLPGRASPPASSGQLTARSPRLGDPRPPPIGDPRSPCLGDPR